MGRPYATEMSELPGTYAWASRCSVTEFADAIRASGDSPLFAVGSGGSLTAAAFWAMMHEFQTGRLSKHGSPLELRTFRFLRCHAVGLVSASGSNADILDAFKVAAVDEPTSLIGLTHQANSKLRREAEPCEWAQIAEFEPPVKKDGFLATNSILSAMVLIYRAYCEAFGQPCLVPSELPGLGAAAPSIARDQHTVSLLYGDWGQIAAIDIESKLVEGGLRNVHLADYRNFGHGRHNWLNKNIDTTTTVALVTPMSKSLSERTLALLPRKANVVALETSEEGALGAVELVVKSFNLINEMSSLMGLDPGRPRVPEFGRKLYRLRPGNLPRREGKPPVGVLLERKLRGPVHHWPSQVIEATKQALSDYLSVLGASRFGGVVFDYDDTLCPKADRFGRLPQHVADMIAGLIANGISVGIATGRGRSVAHSLRNCLDSDIWNDVSIGFYNGAQVLNLSDGDPDNSPPTDGPLVDLQKALTRHPVISNCCELELRPNQITVTPMPSVLPATVHRMILELIALERWVGLSAVRSRHSVDIIGPEVSKRRVVAQVCAKIQKEDPEAQVLSIGDSGGWDGNDLHLLASPYSISVADCPSNPHWAWNLSPLGQRGPQVIGHYASSLRVGPGAFEIEVDDLVGDIS